jgi:hypothetical protein
LLAGFDFNFGFLLDLNDQNRWFAHRDWNVFVLVYRCDDDWYLIELDKDQQTSYWKCDQITGIIDFLENIDDIKTKADKLPWSS